MEQSIWQEIGQLYQKFQELGISEAVDYENSIPLSPIPRPLRALRSPKRKHKCFSMKGWLPKENHWFTIWWTRT